MHLLCVYTYTRLKYQIYRICLYFETRDGKVKNMSYLHIAAYVQHIHMNLHAVFDYFTYIYCLCVHLLCVHEYTTLKYQLCRIGLYFETRDGKVKNMSYLHIAAYV